MDKGEPNSLISDDSKNTLPEAPSSSSASNLPDLGTVAAPPKGNNIVIKRVKSANLNFNFMRCIQKLVKIRKNIIDNHIRTWNLLDIKLECEVMEIEKMKKKKILKKAGLTSISKVQTRECKFYDKYDEAEVPDSYKGHKLIFPLKIENVKDIIEDIKKGSIYSFYLIL